MTNFEKIKQMSVEELAQFMFSMVDCISCEQKLKMPNDLLSKCNGDGRKCKYVCKKWLESEADTEQKGD